MSQNPPPDHTPPNADPVAQVPLQRGFLLGLPIFGALIAGAVLIYLLSGLFGWGGNIRIIVALCLGPLLGFGVIGLIFVIFKPKVL